MSTLQTLPPAPKQTPTGKQAFEDWIKTRGVWPRLTHEEIWRAAWNAAIDSADTVAWEHRDKWEESTPERKDATTHSRSHELSKAKAAEEIGQEIRALKMLPPGA
jgi:hypothetical protein